MSGASKTLFKLHFLVGSMTGQRCSDSMKMSQTTMLAPPRTSVLQLQKTKADRNKDCRQADKIEVRTKFTVCNEGGFCVTFRRDWLFDAGVFCGRTFKKRNYTNPESRQRAR